MSATRIGRAGAGRAALALGVLAAIAAVLVTTEPDVRAASARIADAQTTLRSDEVAFAQAPRLERERTRLGARFARDLATDPQAVVLHALSTTLRLRGVTFGSTQNAAVVPVAPPGGATTNEFEDVHLDLDLRGTYRAILLVIDDLPRACELTRVDAASLHRSGNALTAHLSIALLRSANPAVRHDTPAAVTPAGGA